MISEELPLTTSPDEYAGFKSGIIRNDLSLVYPLKLRNSITGVSRAMVLFPHGRNGGTHIDKKINIVPLLKPTYRVGVVVA